MTRSGDASPGARTPSAASSRTWRTPNGVQRNSIPAPRAWLRATKRVGGQLKPAEHGVHCVVAAGSRRRR
ncbi:MAG: hypothetical protein U1A27_02595 [Phycisphaerae bacterium]